MDGLFDSALENLLNNFKDCDALHGASTSEIAIYSRQWTKACKSKNIDELDSISRRDAVNYFLEFADTRAVERVLHRVVGQAKDIITKDDFLAAAHILYAAIKAAQEAIFANSDAFFSDAPPASKHQKGHTTSGSNDREWVIGTLASSVLSSAISDSKTFSRVDDEEEEEEQEDDENSSPSTYVSAVSIGDSISPIAATFATEIQNCYRQNQGKDDDDDEVTSAEVRSSLDAEWKAFDDAFTHLHVSIQEEYTTNHHHSNVKVNLKPAWAKSIKPLSLAGITSRLSLVPGTALRPMTPLERQRCEQAFRSKGYETSGLKQSDALHLIFNKTNVDQSVFKPLWHVSNITGAGALDMRQFCLFMHLLKSVVEGSSLPDSISHLQAAQLLGDVPLGCTSYGLDPNDGQGYSSARLGTGRLRSVLREEASKTPRHRRHNRHPSGNAQHNTNPNEFHNNNDDDNRTQSRNGTLRDSEKKEDVVDEIEEEDDDCSDVDVHDDDDDCSENGCVDDSTDCANVYENYSTCLPVPDDSEILKQLSSFGSSGRGQKSKSHDARDVVPRLPPLAATTSGAPPSPTTSRLNKAVWEAEAGQGHTTLELILRTAALMQRKPLDRPLINLSVRDPTGRLIELPLDSHPGLYRSDIGCIEFSNQCLTLSTPLRSLPPGCLLFLEIRQWKSDKKKFSTVAWTFVDAEMMVDAGTVCSRVRCGPMVLPLFKKPMDTSLQKLRRLNRKGPALHIAVRGGVS